MSGPAMTVCPECGERMNAYALPGHVGRKHPKGKTAKAKPPPKLKGVK